jgi:maltokinase
MDRRMDSTDPAELLPARRTMGADAPVEVMKVLDALDLGRGRLVLLLETSSGPLASAVVEEHDGFRRARAGDGVAEELLSWVATGDDLGRFAFRRLGPMGSWSGEQPIEVDQSNESIVVGGSAVVKRFVWIAPGNQRPSKLPAHLVAAGFEEIPAPLGNASWEHPDGVAPLVSIATFLSNARDGWDWYVELLERMLDDPGVEAVEPAVALGSITARLHVALATPTDVLASPIGTAGEEMVEGWRRDAEADLDAALGDEGSRLRENEQQIRTQLAEIRSSETVTIPIHGDLHVGQFLRWSGGLAVSDLDGDPLGPGTLAGPPVRDVASLVQSIDHVGRIVERRRGASVAGWIRDASDACVDSYRAELAARGSKSLFDERLLRPFRVAQELHELVYAARFLPDWRYVPDAALPALLEERGGDG